MYNTPPLDTVARVAFLKLETSNNKRIYSSRGNLSPLVKVKTLLSSMTVFRDSIQFGSISPSKIIHLFLCVSLYGGSFLHIFFMIELRIPYFQAFVLSSTYPNNSLPVIAFGDNFSCPDSSPKYFILV